MAAMIMSALGHQAYLFDREFRRLAGSVRLERTADRTLVRRGAIIGFVTAISLECPRRMEVCITELLPDLVALLEGEISVTVTEPGPHHDLRLAYRVAAVAHGTFRVRGLILRASNRFFENRMEMTADRFRGPDLLVQPRGSFDAPSNRGTLGTREIERVSAITGYGIRSLRDYLAGDDPRRIDWKLSAKHDKLLVREYSAEVGQFPLLVVDLPRRDTGYSEDEFQKMVTMVAGMAENSIREHNRVSVLFISGSNILHFIENEKNVSQCMSGLREWLHPAEQTDFLYRFTDRNELRAQVRKIDTFGQTGNDSRNEQFFSCISRVLSSAIQNQGTPAFAGMIVRTLAGLTVNDVYIFSLLTGDTSHIRLIVRLLRSGSREIHLRVSLQVDEVQVRYLRKHADARSIGGFA
jgi:uncharacterized protein (DUF58 family)